MSSVFPQLSDLPRDHAVSIFRAMDAAADAAENLFRGGSYAEQAIASRIAHEIRMRALARYGETAPPQFECMLDRRLEAAVERETARPLIAAE